MKFIVWRVKLWIKIHFNICFLMNVLFKYISCTNTVINKYLLNKCLGIFVDVVCFVGQVLTILSF